MTQYNCNFCFNAFATEILLDKHKTNTKYCLELQEKELQGKELQGKELQKKKEKHIFRCPDCNNNFSTKQSLTNHINVCKITKQKLLNDKDEEIKKLRNFLLQKDTEKDNEIKNLLLQINELKNKQNNDEKLIAELQAKLEIYKDSQDCLKEIAKQPKTIQNKNIQNKSIQNNNHSVNNKYVYLTPLDLTHEIIKQKVEENFTKKHLIEGQKGVAIFTYDNLLLDENNNLKYLCGDTSRNLFYYKNPDGTIEKDPKATNLTKMIVEDVIAKSHNMVMEILDNDTIEMLQKLDYQNIFYDIKHLRDDNGKFISNLSSLTSNKKPIIKQITPNLEI